MNEPQRTKRSHSYPFVRVTTVMLIITANRSGSCLQSQGSPGLLNALKGIDISMSCETIGYEAVPWAHALEHTAGRGLGELMEPLGPLLEEVGSQGGRT